MVKSANLFQATILCHSVCSFFSFSLSIHDSFVVKRQHKQILEDMMVEAYEALGFMSVPKMTGG